MLTVKSNNIKDMASNFRAFWNSPVGPKTAHFWGPVANWGFVAAVGYSIFFILFQIKLSLNY